LNFLLRFCVSSWMTPNALPLGVHSGTHMTERMRKSTTLWLSCTRSSRVASSLRKAWDSARQRRTMLLLNRAVVSSPAMRVLTRRGTSRLPSSSARMRKQRSAWRNSWKRLSPIFGKSRSSCSVLLRLALISSRPRSFSAGWSWSSMWLLWLSVASTVVLPPSSSSPSSLSRKTATKSQMRILSLFLSGVRAVTAWLLTKVPLRLCRSSMKNRPLLRVMTACSRLTEVTGMTTAQSGLRPRTNLSPSSGICLPSSGLTTCSRAIMFPLATLRPPARRASAHGLAAGA
jgi:hypothetical protein